MARSRRCPTWCAQREPNLQSAGPRAQPADQEIDTSHLAQAAGARLSFHAVSTLTKVAGATVAALARTADPAHVATARGARDLINGPQCGASPPLNPISFEPSARSPNRLWVVNFTSPLPAAVGPCTLIDADGWSNAGARVEGSHFFGGIDGLRWKSSGGAIVDTLWEHAVSSTGLEVTPLQSFLEGPLAISDVLIARNTFTDVPPSQASQLITACEGMSHKRHTQPFASCSNITQRDNTFVPPQPAPAPTATPPPRVSATFEDPTLVHRSYGGQHAWFSSVLAPAGRLVVDMSLGGDGTPCPPPGKTQNCSMYAQRDSNSQSPDPARPVRCAGG
jgi:hypothetical protein